MIPSNETLFKQQVKETCLAHIMQRIQTAEQAMHAAQEAANSEDKSSAGDKYETARAMGQADRDMNARQLSEALREKQILDAIQVTTAMTLVGPGALLQLEQAWFFIAIGLGHVKAGGKDVVVLSAASPLYKTLQGKRTGDSVIFQGRETVINAVF